MNRSMHPRRILLVASDFPPLVGTNTQRIQSFVRHLSARGHACTVVTQAVADLARVDMRDLERVPAAVKVVRINDPDPFATRQRRVRSASAAAAATAVPVAITARPPSSALPLSLMGSRIKRLLARGASGLLKHGLRQFAYQPDGLRLWAARVAGTLSADWPIGQDVVVTSSPAFSCHLAGLTLKRRLGLPWVADFRDLWVGRPFRQMPSPLHARWDAWQEARVVKACDKLVLASPAWRADFERRYGAAVAGKLVVITNGYEAEDMRRAREAAALAAARRPGCLRFVLTGSMHAGESPLPMLQALALLARRSPLLAAKVELVFIGDAGDHQAELSLMVKQAGLSAHVQFVGPQSNQVCLQAQCEADWLMLFSASAHIDTLRGKSFEYMASGKPIFACIPRDGIQAQVLVSAGTALVVEHGDVDAISAALLRILQGEVAPASPDWDYIARFDRAVLAKQLEEVIEAACADPQRPKIDKA